MRGYSDARMVTTGAAGVMVEEARKGGHGC